MSDIGRTARRAAKAAAVAGAGLGIAAWLRDAERRARLSHMMRGIRDTVLPSHTPERLPVDPATDEAHAPGHRHLGPPPAEPPRHPAPSTEQTVVSHRSGHVHKG
jgi:hypothetical protein